MYNIQIIVVVDLFLLFVIYKRLDKMLMNGYVVLDDKLPLWN